MPNAVSLVVERNTKKSSSVGNIQASPQRGTTRNNGKRNMGRCDYSQANETSTLAQRLTSSNDRYARIQCAGKV